MHHGMHQKPTLVIMVVVLSAGALFAWFQIWLQPPDLPPEGFQKKGGLRIGYAVEAPYAFLDPDGAVTGESPELAKVIAARLGIAIAHWRQTEFSALLAELEAERIDLIAAGMFTTPERARRVAFSLPTFQVRQGLLVAKGNPHGLHSYHQAVGTGGIKLAALPGSVEEALLKRLGIADARLVLVPDALTGQTAVATGVADGLALSSPTLRWMVLNAPPGLTELARPFAQPPQSPPGLGGFAFRKNDRRLLAAWNSALRSYLGSPEHLALIGRFGFTAEELPPPLPDPEDSLP